MQECVEGKIEASQQGCPQAGRQTRLTNMTWRPGMFDVGDGANKDNAWRHAAAGPVPATALRCTNVECCKCGLKQTLLLAQTLSSCPASSASRACPGASASALAWPPGPCTNHDHPRGQPKCPSPRPLCSIWQSALFGPLTIYQFAHAQVPTHNHAIYLQRKIKISNHYSK